MIQINKNILKKLMAIADANDDDDYFYIKHYVIDQLKIATDMMMTHCMIFFEKLTS